MQEAGAGAVRNYLRYKEDPWAFLSECVYTLDQVDSVNPVKLFPKHFEYLRFFTQLWKREDLIAVPKSRRMTMSWTCLSLIAHDIIFNPGRSWAVVSKKEDDSGDLVSRIEFIINHIPEDKLPKELLPKIKGGKMKSQPPYMEMQFGEGSAPSTVRGFAQGADQMRQYTLSGIFGDECAFWEQAQKFYSASKPTIDGGGKMVLVSSRAPGFFKKIVFDKINHEGYEFPEIPPAEPQRPIEGVELYRNPTNKFVVMDIHYTANPAKRGKAFREAVRASMPYRDYLMEYEKNWNTFEGLPVFEDFNQERHKTLDTYVPQTGLPLILGWDFGLTPACIVSQLEGNTLHIMREYTAKNESIKKFAPKVMRDLRMRYPSWTDATKDFLHFVDPAGFARAEHDEGTCVKEMRLAGLRNIHPGPVTWEARKSAVVSRLMYIDKDGPGIILDARECSVLIEGFSGGYRYPDSLQEIEPSKARPLKDSYSHPHDALQYLCGGIETKKISNIRQMPVPHYSFQGDGQTTQTYSKGDAYNGSLKKQYGF